MKILALTLGLALLAGSAHAAPPALNSLTAKEKASGWKLLFDGKTLNGWRNFKKPRLEPGWRVEKGILTLDPKVAEDIITKDQYRDFDLKFEWRISKGGNSGVFYRVSEVGNYPDTYETGPEYQILDNGRGEPPQEQAASLFGLYAPAKDVTKPVGQFNRGEIIVRHGHVEHWLNGVKVVEYDLGSPDFRARVAKTKFAQWPDFAKAEAGHIGLQNHGDEVAFRNIKIRPLD